MSSVDRETWRAVPGWPCHASNHGRVSGPSGKTLKPYVADDGYLHVLIRRRKLRVHHAVLFAFVGPRPEGQECRHLDGDPANNRLGNLRWGTRSENVADRAVHGTECRGERKPLHRLWASQIKAIRRDKRASRVIGAEYGVSHTTILAIRRGRLWRDAA